MRPNNFILIIFAFICFSPFSAWSAKVKKIKGKTALIYTQGSKIQKGALYYLVAGGKKKAIIKITKTKPGQALGVVLKGRAMPGYSLVRRPSKKRKAVAKKKRRSSEPLPPLKTAGSSSPKKKRSYSDPSESHIGIGGVISFGLDRSSVDFDNGDSSSGSGSAMSFELIADYKFTDKISFRGSIGMQNFSTEDSGTQIAPSNDDAVIDLGYINLDVWGRYHFTPKYWAGGGVGVLLSPSYGSTNAITEDGLSTTTFLQVGGGADFKFGSKYYIPVWAEYGTFLQSGDASISSISLKAGFAMRL